MKCIVLISIEKDKMDTYLQSWKQKKKHEVNILHGPYIMFQSIEQAHSFVVIETDQTSKAVHFCKSLKGTSKIVLNLMLDVKEALEELEKFNTNKNQAEKDYKNAKIDKILNIGATSKLEILPLIDWHTDNKDLKVETGVSYLIKTDDTTILFDVGLNSEQEDPSPLISNMQKLGVSLDEIDIIFLTHNHADHVGGSKWFKEKTFSLTGRQINLGNKKVYTPVTMTYPGLNPVHLPDPIILGSGVASTGTTPNSQFIYGITEEMGLAVNVEGKGIVLIIGCGHQTLPRILERSAALFDIPLYGILGGLHYPVLGGPIEIFGFSPHMHWGTGKAPWDPISVDELSDNIELLKKYKPKLVALSPHDSSELSIQAFRDVFPDAFREILVGKKIIIQ